MSELVGTKMRMFMDIGSLIFPYLILVIGAGWLMSINWWWILINILFGIFIITFESLIFRNQEFRLIDHGTFRSGDKRNLSQKRLIYDDLDEIHVTPMILNDDKYKYLKYTANDLILDIDDKITEIFRPKCYVDYNIATYRERQYRIFFDFMDVYNQIISDWKQQNGDNTQLTAKYLESREFIYNDHDKQTIPHKIYYNECLLFPQGVILEVIVFIIILLFYYYIDINLLINYIIFIIYKYYSKYLFIKNMNNAINLTYDLFESMDHIPFIAEYGIPSIPIKDIQNKLLNEAQIDITSFFWNQYILQITRRTVDDNNKELRLFRVDEYNVLYVGKFVMATGCIMSKLWDKWNNDGARDWKQYRDKQWLKEQENRIKKMIQSNRENTNYQ